MRRWPRVVSKHYPKGQWPWHNRPRVWQSQPLLLRFSLEELPMSRTPASKTWPVAQTQAS